MQWLTNSWYQHSVLRWLLSPLSGLYRLITGLRKRGFERGWFTSYKLPVPVIVVGNISVGGTGKTPFVIWLAEQLKQAGYRPGIISRGYGGNAHRYPLDVTENTATQLAGDEPVLIARRSGCPVVVDPKRSQAALHLLSHYQCDAIISDDGLQHYALQRDIEIVLVDGQRRFGNKFCLPAGPLREPLARLKHVDFIVFNGSESVKSPFYQMCLQPSQWVNLLDESLVAPLMHFNGQQAHAVAAIGNPQRFFDLLCEHNITVQSHHFADHHVFSAADLNFNDSLPVLMTEKDAVKCRDFAHSSMWYLPVSAALSEELSAAILLKLKGLQHG